MSGIPRRRRRALRPVLITLGTLVGVAGISLGVILTVGGIFVPATYLEPWSTTYYQRFPDPRMQVVSQALLAPSGHNMQPWIIELDPTDSAVLYLYADPTRLSPAVDPDARQALVSQGTFLAYLQVSAAHLGYAAAVELFPGGTYDESNLENSMTTHAVARVTLSRDPAAATDDYPSLFLSDTNRAPYTPTALSPSQTAVLNSLADASPADPSPATLAILSEPADLSAIGQLAIEGTRIETKYLPATVEFDAVFHGTEEAKNKARSGFAVEGQGTSGFMKYLLQGLITLVPSLNDDATAAKNSIALTAAAVHNTSAYALISTAGNTRLEQVEAGMLYARFSLRARTLGLVVQPLSQVLQEYPTMAVPYAAIHARYAQGGETIQMLVRVGSPTTQYPVTMRRDAGSFLRKP